MNSLKFLDSIAPTWYKLQTSASGSSYVQLPQRASGEDIFLTPFQRTDIPAVATLLDDPALNDTLISVPKPYTSADAEFWVTLQLSGQSGLSLQALRSGDPETGAYVGAVTLLPTDSPQGYELGYYLHPEYHRKGIMRDAVLAALAWGSQEARVRTVVVIAEESNSASIKLIQSIPEFLKLDTAKEVQWPENKGGGKRRLLHWQWHYNG